MIGSWIRRTGFWVLDALRGGSKRECYNFIQKNYGKIQNQALGEVLNYATQHVPAYKEYADKPFSDFPVVNKQYIRQYGEEKFLSEEYLGKNLHEVFTSGSTGTPFRVVQDGNKRMHVICDLLYAHNSVGWRLGDRYVFIRNWVSNYKQSKLKSIIQNVHNVNITGFDEEQKMQLVKYLSRNKKTVLFGYASAINEFAAFAQKKGIDLGALKVKLVVCDSDELTSASRKKLEELFCCPVINRYDNEENGLLGISAAGEDRIYLNTAGLYFELLALDSNEPVAPGEVGRIVVTDLFNHAMPLIRYDLGDLGISNDDAGNIKTLESFAGRTAGSLTNIEGRLVSNVSISGALEPFTNIERYQICQEKNHTYVLSYVGALNESEKEELMRRMKNCFGSTADIYIKSVDDIPVGANGKHKTTINNT